MKTRNEIINWATEIDKKYADLTTKYGAYKVDGIWNINLWQPKAKKVIVIIFDKNDQNKEVKRIEGEYKEPNWKWAIKEDLEGYFYQYEITHENNEITRALDPFAKSMAAFNWEGDTKKVGKAAFVDFAMKKILIQPSKVNNSHHIIYEGHVRDLTSLRKDVKNPGSFNALKEIKMAEHLQNLGFTTIQFLPLHNCYTLDENNKNITEKGEGKGWNTNYNWGYDPHNYFSINGWYSTNANNPYARMEEFKKTVEYFHSNDINVIVDVVYNHLMTNSILDNVFPEYYFRGGSDTENIVTPVQYPPLASERAMCRRIIIESLEWFVQAYDVDGFRFDLSSFIDKETLKVATKRLKALKPNIILHGEAWQWSDLEYHDSLVKGITDNNYQFGYFNDTTRNAIKGDDDAKELVSGILGKNIDKKFSNYLSSVIGNIKDFKNAPLEIATDSYARFTDYPDINLQYAACHDGHTLWDKINLTTKGDKKYKFEIFRQAVLLQNTTQGKVLFLAGTEMLYSKPNDASGQDGDKYHESEDVLDLFELGNKFNHNTYKTTDYSCGLRWNQLTNEVKEKIYDFIKKINNFRTSTPFFNLPSSESINKCLKFNFVDKAKGIIDYKIKVDSRTIRVIHNLKDTNYSYVTNGQIILDSKLEPTQAGLTLSHSSQIIAE